MKNKHILLVEDNPDDVELMLRALKMARIDHEVSVARDGVEALDYLFEKGTLPRVIFLDINMPKISGLEVLKRLRADERTRRIPVVLFTSSKEDTDIRQGYGLGVNSYIHKPVDSVQFTDTVKQLAQYWLGLNETLPA